MASFERAQKIFNNWDKKDSLELDRGVIKTEANTGRTSVKGIYAGGDAAYGPALFITAIRHGQNAALTIDQDFKTYSVTDALIHHIA